MKLLSHIENKRSENLSQIKLLNNSIINQNKYINNLQINNKYIFFYLNTKKIKFILFITYLS